MFSFVQLVIHSGGWHGEPRECCFLGSHGDLQPVCSSCSPGVGKEIGKNRDSGKRGNDRHGKKCC